MRSRAAGSLAVIALACLLWCASAGAQSAEPASRPVVTARAPEGIDAVRGRKLLALYLTTIILVLLAVMIMVATLRIRYERDRPRGPAQPMKDVWFLNDPRDRDEHDEKENA